MANGKSFDFGLTMRIAVEETLTDEFTGVSLAADCPISDIEPIPFDVPIGKALLT